jgi:DNA helicase HerA-like ATPase
LLLAVGMRGSGKTWFLRNYLEGPEPRVLALDPHNDFPRLLKYPDWELALERLEEGDPARARFNPFDQSQDTRAFGETFLRACVERLRNAFLAIDEISLYSTGLSDRGSALETVTLQGRHYGIRSGMACQRLNRIPMDLRSQATEIVVFRTAAAPDLDVLKFWGGKELAEVAPTLERGECCVIFQ